MVLPKWLPLLAVAVLLIEPTISSNILGYFITPSPSHFIIHDSLMRGLAAKGHKVTVVSLFPPPKNAIPNYTSIQLDMTPESEAIWKAISGNFLKQAENQESVFRRGPEMLQSFNRINTETYTHPLVETLRREKSFDLVVFGSFFNDYQVGLAAHFKCPAVVIASTETFKSLRNLVGNPSGPAYTPMVFTGFPAKMSYLQRAANLGVSIVETIVTGIVDQFVYEPVYSQNFPPNKYPSYSDAKKNVGLVLVTSHFSQGHPMVSFPAMVEVSGMHIKRSPDPLPIKLKEWLDTAKNGVVYFSLGTNINSNDMAGDKLQAVMRVLGRIKQRVLWKFGDDNLPGKPDNVMIQKWLPQDDVLAHPNVRLFISHCGKGGINEARYHGVPILAIPIFADQPSNAANIESEGWAVTVQYSDLAEATFEAALTEALANPKYGEVVKTQSMLSRDRPQHPLDTALFWVEYVIRHKGAKHMQSPAVHLTWYQYHSVDVIALYLFVIWAIYKVTKCALRSFYRLVFTRKSKSKKE